MMKKLISLLCVFTLMVGLIAVAAVSASAATEPAKTEVSVKKGNTVTYVLKLTVPDAKVVGSQYAIYYDPSVLKVDSVLDFNDKGEDEWDGAEMINPNADGAVVGNFSILRGVDFKQTRNFITVNFTAVADGKTNISYYFRYLYDFELKEFTNYKFVCDVTVNGDTVIEDAQPELNVKEQQKSGEFVNSVTGDSKDADPEVSGTVINYKESSQREKDAGDSLDNIKFDDNGQIVEGGDNAVSGDNSAAGNSAGGNASGNNNAGSSANINSGSAKNTSPANDATQAPAATTKEGYYILATDSSGNVTATSDEAPEAATVDSAGKKGSKSVILWIILGAIVLIGGGAGAYFYFSKKSGGNGPDNNGVAPVSPAADENTVVADAGDEKTQLLEKDDQ